MFTNDDMDQIFHALAHKTRRTILDILRAEPGLSVGRMASNFDVSRIAIINHLAVLESADLVISRKEGRSRCLYLNIIPLQLIYERWTDEYSGHWASKLTTIKHAAEKRARIATQADWKKSHE